MVDTLLVSMPFGDAFTPSIGLSLLQPQLRRRGLTCDILYLTFPFAERIGQDLYCSLATNRHGSLCDLTGEWLFSDALFDRAPDRDHGYVREILIGGKAWEGGEPVDPLSPARMAAILGAKGRVAAFLDWAAGRIEQAAPRILGFTSVFQQHVASLALARLIKARRPETLIVFGGANCEGVMGAETVRRFPFVDAVVSGEGDVVFPELARRAIDGASWSELPGVLSRDTVEGVFASGCFPHTPMVTDLGSLPFPDYSDYFAQFNRSRLARDWQPSIFVETSRGCWWGERMHCTFCGLNGGTMAFRSKSADRALAELEHLSAAHPDCEIQVVDNILDLKYFNTLLPALAARKLKLQLFFETKSNLKKDQVRLLRDAGVTSIQPGIESLSDQVLKLMKKGVSALQNIQLLKWCKQFGVEPNWNLLIGFPGESPAEYRRMAELVPLLMHLPGPLSASTLRLDRFSPNFFDAANLGFANVRPLAPYRFIYDVPEEALENLAYYFAYDYRHPTDVWEYARTLIRRAERWRTQSPFELLRVDGDGVAAVLDTRPAAKAPVTVLAGFYRDVYVACDALADPDTIERTLAAGGRSVARSAIATALAAMVDRGIVVSDGHRYLALAIPFGAYVPAGAGAAKLLALLSSESAGADGRVWLRLDRPEYQLDWKAAPGCPGKRRHGAAGARARTIPMSRADLRIVGQRELRVRRAWSARYAQ